MAISLSQRATANIAALSLLVACGALGISLYSAWLEPVRVRLRIEEVQAQRDLAEANTELAKATIQLTEWLDNRDRMEKVAREAAKSTIE